MVGCFLLVIINVCSCLGEWSEGDVNIDAQSWKIFSRTIPSGYEGTVTIKVDTDSRNPWPVANDEIQLCFPATSCTGQLTGNVESRTYSSLRAGTHKFYVDCLNESDRCLLKVDLRLETRPLVDTETPGPCPDSENDECEDSGLGAGIVFLVFLFGGAIVVFAVFAARKMEEERDSIEGPIIVVRPQEVGAQPRAPQEVVPGAVVVAEPQELGAQPRASPQEVVVEVAPPRKKWWSQPRAPPQEVRDHKSNAGRDAEDTGF